LQQKHFLTLSNPIFLPIAYSPALIYFGRERGWWIACNSPTVLKEKNINRKSTTCAIFSLKPVLHEEKGREQENRKRSERVNTKHITHIKAPHMFLHPDAMLRELL
jgi:hypothetical protein